VVDDEEPIRQVVLRALARFGYEAVSAGDGAEALRILARERIDVVLTDVRMPGMDGLTLLREIRLRYPEMAVVMATAVSEVSVAVECLQMGAHDFLTKPFSLDGIRARLTQALEKQQLVVENRAYQQNLEGMVREQASRIEELFLEGVQSLAHALDAKDSYTHGHSARVRAYAGAIARQVGLSEDVVQLTELGAELHDIGKIGVVDDVLTKPGRLTEQEYLHLMEHTKRGEIILKDLLKNAPISLAIVRSHHERLDGGGFPDGLRGEALPVPVRIVTIADSFDAMTTARPYRDARASDWAFQELQTHAGTQFDGELVCAFRAAYPRDTVFPIETPDRTRLTLPDSVSGVGRLSS
jgi:putative two-component system response regulator